MFSFGQSSVASVVIANCERVTGSLAWGLIELHAGVCREDAVFGDKSQAKDSLGRDAPPWMADFF
jgi:hypothetical protein